MNTIAHLTRRVARAERRLDRLHAVLHGTPAKRRRRKARPKPRAKRGGGGAATAKAAPIRRRMPLDVPAASGG